MISSKIIKRYKKGRNGIYSKRINTSLKDNHAPYDLLSFLISLPISVLCTLELEAYKLYVRANKLYKAELLTRCYVQHFVSPFISSEVNHK